MTSDVKRTGLFAGVAAVLVLLAVVTMPRAREAAVFAAQGSEFYPGFKDPLKAAALEVIEYDELVSAPRPFRVQVVSGSWSIPSHENYPADGKDRLAKTAASVIDLKKERLASDNAKDHEELGVVDPLDAAAKGAKGRGKRVRIFDQAGSILADYIFGKETKEGPEQRYVRVADQKQTWAVKVKPDISVKFEDWVETDLLKFGTSSVRKVTIDKYTFDAIKQDIKDKATYTALREDNSAPWKVSDQKDTEEPNTETLTTLTSTLTGLKLTGVRKKPPLVASAKDVSDLGRLPQNALMAVARALSGKGFFIYSENKNTYGIICSEGEMQVSCDDGVAYTLRFGDVLVGSDEEISAGVPDDDGKEKRDEKKDPKKDDKKPGTTENRYLMVSVRYDDALLGSAPVEPKAYVADPAKKPEEQKAAEEAAKKAKEEYDGKKKDWDKKKTDGKKRAEELQARFAQWYYVISADAFKKLRVERSALLKAKEAPKDEKKPEVPFVLPKDEKKPEPPKEEKKPEAPKDEKKPEEKKSEEKKPEDKKPEEKKAETPKPPDDKPKPPEEKKP